MFTLMSWYVYIVPMHKYVCTIFAGQVTNLYTFNLPVGLI